MPGSRWIRNAEMASLLDSFLISAVGTIVVIRFQLWATGYPKLGSGRLHIAHLLWGGLGMAIAVALLLSVLGRTVRRAAAVVGGIGFGFFIDELGKFVTSNNDYFFKPTAALVYIVFVLFYLAGRAVSHRRPLTPAECLTNAAELVVEAARRDLEPEERARALELLRRADPDEPLVPALRAILERSETRLTAGALRARRISAFAAQHYAQLVEASWFGTAFAGVALVWATASTVHSGVLLVSPDPGASRLIGWAALLASIVVAAITWSAVSHMADGRMDAYRLFDLALLASIFLAQVLAFAQVQFQITAIAGLGLTLALLVTLRRLMRLESRVLLAPAGAAERSGEGIEPSKRGAAPPCRL